jgi:hypothetical protein
MNEMRGADGRGPRFEVPRAPHPRSAVIESRQRVLLDDLVEFQRVISAAEAGRVRALAEAAALSDEKAELENPDRPVEGREMGRRSMRAEIATALRVSERMVDAEVAEAETVVASLPGTLAALESGEITRQHVRKMVSHACSLPASVVGVFESTVLPIAATHNPARFDALAGRMRERLHPDSITVRTRQAFEDRAVWIQPEPDGMASLHLTTSAEHVYAIERRLDAHARALNTAEEPRTVAQLRADVAVDMLVGGSAATVGSVPVTLMVTVPAATLAGLGSGDGGEDAGFLTGYGPIAPEVARKLAAAAPSFTRVLTHPETGEVVSVGREAYRVPAGMRRRLMLEDERCRFTGCGRTAASCDADHTIDWQDDGDTATTNLSMLCRGHHRLKHATAWQVEQDQQRTLRWTSPLGRVTTTEPPARTLARAETRANGDPPY